MQSMIGAAMGLAVFAASAATTQQTSPAPVERQTRYVAMGSSYAAGPGIPAAADGDTRCARSTNNYAHQFARMRQLTLVDVSCSGATTRDILKRSGTTPAQIDAVTPETALVTVTIGGNDVGFVTLLGSASCRQLGLARKAPGGTCPTAPAVTERSWKDLAAAMKRIADEVRQRAPAARLVFVDYPVVLPARGHCTATPMTPAEADAARALARRLAAVTAEAAEASGATLVRASSLSRGHDACSNNPWINGFPRTGQARFVPYHPIQAGMTVIAKALDSTIR
ncbi:SGNH/GDSL hydrolase family protein [Sphingomonas sp. BK069]|uniref:SGNH/GDSL hydrolase family protein n=1 Tax=Sphingomonas sp. BK069 TaxID=2586979 RepID=UPI00160B3E80|nr:SGNH/GDSL hydrolase family protein [Sphingomonas sp. BK069]MBB3349880.1 lysophospholipase L1-like esterase [Sphingomonas sp. BK069]